MQPLPDATGATILRWIVSTSEQYYLCSDKQKALAEAVTK